MPPKRVIARRAFDERERALFRRLGIFVNGFSLEGAVAAGSGEDLDELDVFDVLASLVDKSLVTVDDSGGRTRYRLLETVRQYALEKLGESGEADGGRSRHRDYYTTMAAVLDAPADRDYEQLLAQANIEIDNLRAAFAWSRENSDIEPALALASALQPLWLARGRLREGLAWFDATLTDRDAQQAGVAGAVRARALADKAVLDAYLGAANSLDQAEQAVAIAREVDDPALLARTLTAYGLIASLGLRGEVARACFAEAMDEVRAGRATVAVLPMPTEGEAASDVWWTALLHRDEPRIHVVARLPFWAPRPEGAPRVQALVVAAAAPDASTDDRSLLGLEIAQETSRARLTSLIIAAGFAPGSIILRRDPGAGVAQALVDVAGMVTDDDTRLAAIADQLRPPVVLGGYAVPVEGDLS